jgi:hypothetical protein
MAHITSWSVGNLAGLIALSCTVTEIGPQYCRRCSVVAVEHVGYCAGCCRDMTAQALLAETEYTDAMAEIYADQDRCEKGLY